MPRTRTPESYEELLAETTADAIMADADVMAAESGPPPGKRLSEAEEVRLWGVRDPSVDYATTLQTLLTQGFGETAGNLLVVQENPGLLDAYANPAPTPEVAEALAVLAEYPFRLGLFDGYGDPEDRAAQANRIARAWEKQQPAAPPIPPAPPMTPPVSTPTAPPPPADAYAPTTPPGPPSAPPLEIGG